jgi:hypothetical protein
MLLNATQRCHLSKRYLPTSSAGPDHFRKNLRNRLQVKDCLLQIYDRVLKIPKAMITMVTQKAAKLKAFMAMIDMKGLL